MPIVFVSAGPGWGKTTLLAQWASRSQRPFAWVSVDEKDNDPIVLLTYVAAALDRVSPLDPSVFDALASPGASVEGTVVPRLGAALATIERGGRAGPRRPAPARRPGMPRCHRRARQARARGLAAGAVGARRSRAPAGALRARGLALEIGPDDLRMDEAEARRLLSAAGVDLPDAELAELDRAHGGLARGPLPRRAVDQGARGRGPTARRRSPASDRLVADYLHSELLAHLSRGRCSLPDADLRPRADVGAALRRGARGERLRGDPGVAGALQPVPGAAGRDRRVVSLSPPLPGAAARGARAGRAGSRARAARSRGRMV